MSSRLLKKRHFPGKAPIADRLSSSSDDDEQSNTPVQPPPPHHEPSNTHETDSSTDDDLEERRRALIRQRALEMRQMASESDSDDHSVHLQHEVTVEPSRQGLARQVSVTSEEESDEESSEEESSEDGLVMLKPVFIPK